MTLSRQQRVELNDALTNRRGQLKDELLARLQESEDTRLQSAAGQVRDLGDESMATITAQFYLGQLDRLTGNIRSVEGALRRIAREEYGYCAVCDIDIPFARLRAQPTARFCIDCQREREQLPMEAATPSL